MVNSDVISLGGSRAFIGESNLRLDPHIRSIPEMLARDRQASGYLAFPKHNVQIYRAKQFLQHRNASGGVALDVGCGPGPMTALLLDAGYQVLAVDFSLESLRINMKQCRGLNALFFHADLNDVNFRENSADGLMISDVLQHIGDEAAQRRFLLKAIRSLRRGAWFYLSSFNANLKNRMKRDIVGSFAGGNILYRRLSPGIVRDMLPDDARITTVTPMNIFNHVKADLVVSRFPFAAHFSRMILMFGYRH